MGKQSVYTGQVADLFEDKAKDWDSRPLPMVISEGVGSALLKATQLGACKHILDFGAGTGLICERMAPSAEKIYAVDISEAMLEKLVAKPALQDKVEAICQDIMTTPLGKPVDLIMSAMAMHHVEDTAHLLRTFAEHLSPGGAIALADLDKEDGSFHPADIEGVFHQGFDRKALEGLLRASGFEKIEFVTAVTVEKEDHRYPIFLVTATKT